uniref:Protein MIZU-KUSSEI 1 n=1 Tax=Oryza meridionalis TaxID=40149 RepID=A0A0E0DP97_9ORYZ
MKKKTAASKYLCFASFTICIPSAKQPSGGDAKNRLSFSFPESINGGKDRRCQQHTEEEHKSESIIDPAASVVTRTDGKHCTIIVGTIFGRRSGRVTFCVQRDAAMPPPFLFELSVPMLSLAAEMGSGLLRIALECHQPSGKVIVGAADGDTINNAGTGGGGSRSVWKASCNGRDVGYAVRRRPTDQDFRVLESMRMTTTGVGVLPSTGFSEDGGGGDVLYMRATYERVVGSKDAVSYHLITPGTASGSPQQELSVFLLRTRGD